MGVDDDEKQAIYSEFNACVNLTPKELEDWLETEESQSVGDTHTQGGSGGESTGHKSGKRIVELKRTKKADLSDDDYQHMNKVVGYVHRHLAQHPSGDIGDTNWRYSLMNWGHDPLKDG
jgi:hypothetical protein